MYIYFKRAFDVLVSIIGLVMLSPLLVIVSILIKLDSRGPIIFKQERLGLNGEIFNIYKFRSMSGGAEKEGVYEKKEILELQILGNLYVKLVLTCLLC